MDGLREQARGMIDDSLEDVFEMIKRLYFKSTGGISESEWSVLEYMQD